MNRKRSTALVLSGLALVLATVVGVFALISDTADTGTFSVESADQPSSIDLKIAQTGVSSADVCSNTGDVATANYVDNETLASTLADAAPGQSLTRYVCVHNEGTQVANIGLELLNTVETETGCTGDEVGLDPTTCGTGAGELAPHVDVVVSGASTAAGAPTPSCPAIASQPIVDEASYDGVADTASQAFGTIAGGAYRCFRVVATYDATTTATDQAAAQSDQVSWNFRFHGDL